jgi:hypothetical protein
MRTAVVLFNALACFAFLTLGPVILGLGAAAADRACTLGFVNNPPLFRHASFQLAAAPMAPKSTKGPQEHQGP